MQIFNVLGCRQTSAKLCNSEISVFSGCCCKRRKMSRASLQLSLKNAEHWMPGPGQRPLYNYKRPGPNPNVVSGKLGLLRLQDRSQSTIMSVQPYWVKDLAWVLRNCNKALDSTVDN